MRENAKLISELHPNSPITESFKMFRTNLGYTGIDGKQQVILFTSSTSEEGKTTSICNLAITYAQAGKKTLLVECDLRKARVHELFGIEQTPGLTNVLAGKETLDQVIKQADGIANLDIVTAGPLPPSPSEILDSDMFKTFIEGVRLMYDVILLDAPPVLVVTDALTLNKVVDGIVLVVASSETKKKTLKRAKKSLDQIGAKVLGALITKADLRKGQYFDYTYDSYYTGNSKHKRKTR